jgi:signal peptidase I
MRSAQQISNDTHALKCELAAETLRSSGSLRIQVTGWSMVPTVWPGDTLIIDRTDHGSFSEGDIVLVGRDRRLIAHRLVAKSEAGDSAVLTRGDSMPAPDRLVDQDKVLGKVSFILRNGKRIEPRRTLRISERALATLVQRSEIATRVIAEVHNFRRSTQP